MEHFHFSCQGESHKATNKVCQDYSYSNVCENGMTIAVVCDGHGGQRYFRSDVGARIAGEVTVKNVSFFVDNIEESLFLNKPYTAATAIATQVSNSEFNKENAVDKAFRQLFSSIIFDWTTQIQKHAAENPVSESESTNLKEEWVNDFEQGNSLEKVYGCTLMVFVIMQNYWFAFHIGDGKCYAFNDNGRCYEPIPWDDRCFLNKTTSLCDVQAIDEFRYCYQGDGQFPMAVFLASDGIDDSFGVEENMINFYVQILKHIKNSSKEEVYSEITSTLPELSKIGSQDDMSVSILYNPEKVINAYPQLLDWQISATRSSILQLNARIKAVQDKLNKYESVTELTRKIKIDYDYAVADKKRALEEKGKLVKRINTLLLEQYGEDYTPYMDEVADEESTKD
jgi:serine/threonine protein phosphatase PrpC